MIPDFVALASEGYEAWKRDRPGTIAVDTETTGVAFFDTPFCVTIAWDRDELDYEAHYFELVEHDAREMVREILLETPSWVFHNAKFDLQKLLLAGILEREEIHPSSFEDTEAIAHLIDEHQKKGLKDLAVRILGIEDVVDVEVKSGPNKGTFKQVAREAHELSQVRKELGLTAEDGYHLLPREVVIPYAVTDTVLTLQLYDHYIPSLRHFDDLSGLYEMEKHVTLALLDMEASGMAIDLSYTQLKAKEYGTAAVKKELEIRILTGNEEFLPSSWQQVLAELHRRGINVPDTKSETLEPLDDEFAKSVLELRGTRKIHGTYLLPMLAEQRDGILHPHTRQHGAKTGRMASGGAES